MGKTKTTSSAHERRHNPLENDMLATGIFRSQPRKRKSRHIKQTDSFVDSRASKKILELGRELVEDERRENPGQTSTAPPQSFGFDSRPDVELDEGDEAFEDEEVWGDKDDMEEEEAEVEDLATFNRFLPPDSYDDAYTVLSKHGWDSEARQAPEEEQGTNLADLILAKISTFNAQNRGVKEIGPVDERRELPPRVVDVYTRIGVFLSRYKSGKLPKPLKVLPTLPYWKDILPLTKPESWTPNSCYQVTRIFSSAKPEVSRAFLEMAILDRVRDDIHENKKLNVHLFNSLKKSLFRPAAFFKGFLFPLVDSGTCTLREAHIVSAVLVRCSISVLHSAVAIEGLCDIAAQEASQGAEGGGATNILIKALLEKRYALPFQVVDSLVFHFLRFRSVDPVSIREGDNVDAPMSARAQLPVIWHQCLLKFAQRYRNDITEDQREALLDLLLIYGHHTIGPEIRKELLAGRNRGEAPAEQQPTFDGDDTMDVDP